MGLLQQTTIIASISGLYIKKPWHFYTRCLHFTYLANLPRSWSNTSHQGKDSSLIFTFNFPVNNSIHEYIVCVHASLVLYILVLTRVCNWEYIPGSGARSRTPFGVSCWSASRFVRSMRGFTPRTRAWLLKKAHTYKENIKASYKHAYLQ